MVNGNTAYARTSPPATLMPHLLARSPPGLPTLVSRPRAARAQRIRVRDRTDGAAEPRASAEGGTASRGEEARRERGGRVLRAAAAVPLDARRGCGAGEEEEEDEPLINPH